MSASLRMDRSAQPVADPTAWVMECFVAGWLTLMPVNSFVVIPAIQGTTPAYLLAFVSLLLVFVPGYSAATAEIRRAYIKAILCLSLLWLLDLCLSQMVNLSGPPDYIWTATLINPNDTRAAFRSTIITQSIYLAACISVFLFFRYQFQERWWKYVFWGAWLLAIYGVYEWLYFLVFQTPGDFIANRSYADTPGSWSQTLNFGPLTLLRIKSTQGEPSFLSVVVLPYLYLAAEQRRRCLAAVLLFVAILSTSTSAFFGLLFNCGLSGFVLFAFAFLLPVFRLASTDRGIALKTGLAVMFFLFLISVAELFLPTTWMFLGLAYWQLVRPKSVAESGGLDSGGDVYLPHPRKA